ncbi:unnamed protein product [Cercospora beticola]|nr:unnamed protein product [Cercospora beticola]
MIHLHRSLYNTYTSRKSSSTPIGTHHQLEPTSRPTAQYSNSPIAIRCGDRQTTIMGDEMRAAKKRRIMNNIITITVGGDNGEEFMIHDFLLKENSKFFEAALDRQWKEGQEKKIALPDDDPEVFAVYAGWLFTGKIASKDEKPLDEFTRADVEHEHPLQAKLYVLGEKLIDDKFCDCALKAWAEHYASGHD